jgi:hypothetical protein
MGSGAFAPGSAVRESPFGEHASYVGANAPDDESEFAGYDTLWRVRIWDANVRAGWMPIANGRKRMIPVDPEYEIE